MAERSYGELDRLEVLVDAGRRAVKDEQWGPLEGPWGPSGSGGLTRTASGRSPEDVAAEGPIEAPTTGEVPQGVPGAVGGGLVSRLGLPASGATAGATAGAAGVTASGMGAGMELTPEVLRQAAAMLEAQRQGVVSREPQTQGVDLGLPVAYQPPEEDRSRGFRSVEQQALEGAAARETLSRLLRQVPMLVREALPNSRARSVVLRALDDARLWFREALEELEELEEARQAEQQLQEREAPWCGCQVFAQNRLRQTIVLPLHRLLSKRFQYRSGGNQIAQF